MSDRRNPAAILPQSRRNSAAIPPQSEAAQARAEMLWAAADLEERVRTVHERVPCPKCGAPRGARCRSMPRGYRPLDVEGQFRVLRSPHKWRLKAGRVYLR